MRVSYSKYDVIAGENLSINKAVYIDSFGEARLAKADSESTMPCVGLTEYASSTSGVVTICTNDILDGFSGLVMGNEYYLSQNVAGEITNTKPSGGLVISVGVAVSDTMLDIHIENHDYSHIGFAQASSEGESSTTSQSWQQKLRLTTGNLTLGTYRIGWYCEIKTGDQDKRAAIRVELNDAIVLGEDYTEPDNDNNYWSRGGFKYQTLSGVNNIDFDFKCDESTMTTTVRKTRLEIWRVA